MSFGGFIRRTNYWIIDCIRNRPVRKHFKDIQNVLNNKDNIGFTIKKKHLSELIRHAVKNTEFYSKYEGLPIESFPIINKSIIRDNYNSLTVDNSIIPEHKGKMYIQRTSGSTGIPLAIPQDKRKRNRRVAELKYFGEIAGYKSHEKLAQLRIWTKWHNKSKIQSFRENIVAVDCSKINDEMLSSLSNLIQKKKINAILGYASWFDMLTDYIEKNAIKLPSVKVVIACSEMLLHDTRAKLKKLINCKVVSRYSNEEQGILGQDRDDDDCYYLNHASYFFEFLKLEKDEKAEPGEICRIIVSDLFNYAFPLIRYDTGDTGIYNEGNSKSNGFPILKTIYGRLLDLVYDTQGTSVHPMALARILKNYGQIKLWQFIQKKQCEYELKIKIDGKLNLDDCIYQMKTIFGEDSKIEINIIDDIPVLSSGKLKPVICELKK